MKVIAKSIISRPGELISGKEYDVIKCLYKDSQSYNFWKGDDNFFNPDQPSFFIRVINENGEEYDYWNDYFLSTSEIRDIKLSNIIENI